MPQPFGENTVKGLMHDAKTKALLDQMP